jgi:hypothetical protein
LDKLIEDGGDEQGIGTSGGEPLKGQGLMRAVVPLKKKKKKKHNQNLFSLGMMVWPVYAKMPTGM